ncbi:MAG: hypothetical protein WC829_00775 [Hyphomicrobium sp.]|jgi:hypothetical protein
MRRLRELLRLKYEAGLTHRAIAQACAVGLARCRRIWPARPPAGVTWPLPADLDDAALEARLFARPADPARLDRTVPAWPHLHQELKRPGVTLQLLWTEYRGAHPTGYAYGQFCERHRRWARVLKPSMRQVHRADEKLFVDFSGKRPALVDATTGELVLVELFVGVLGASGLIYAEATRSQDLASWVGAHVRMVEYYGGSPAIWVPDNLKSGVMSGNQVLYRNLRLVTRSDSQDGKPFKQGDVTEVLGIFSVHLGKAWQIAAPANGQSQAVSVAEALEFFVFTRAAQKAVMNSKCVPEGS